jgi:hypothetical protein
MGLEIYVAIGEAIRRYICCKSAIMQTFLRYPESQHIPGFHKKERLLTIIRMYNLNNIEKNVIQNVIRNCEHISRSSEHQVTENTLVFISTQYTEILKTSTCLGVKENKEDKYSLSGIYQLQCAKYLRKCNT